jgi:hypothetical protein
VLFHRDTPVGTSELLTKEHSGTMSMDGDLTRYVPFGHGLYCVDIVEKIIPKNLTENSKFKI